MGNWPIKWFITKPAKRGKNPNIGNKEWDKWQAYEMTCVYFIAAVEKGLGLVFIVKENTITIKMLTYIIQQFIKTW